MSVPCPKCQSALNIKGQKAGEYKPKCPKCGTRFLLQVPEDPNGTVIAKLLPDDGDTVKPPQPKTSIPKQTVGAPKTRTLNDTDPKTTGAATDVGDTDSASQAYQADPNSTGAFTEVDRGNPDKTGAFSPSAVASPDATGDFTELNDRNPDQTGAFSPSGVDEQVGSTNAYEPTEAEPKKPTSKKTATKETDDYPDRLGGYEVVKVLGKGGMGAVLLGRQISLDRKVALKVMHPKIAKNPAFVARFTREAYAAAQLVHHNVVQIYDIGEETGTHYFSMEFVAGKSLMDEVKEKGKLDPEVAVGYILQAARGLRYGHNQGMVHRDIKPDNLMLNTEGVVKVADLGLVKLPNSTAAPADEPITEADMGDDEEDDGRLTQAGMVMGTPSYMPPEQALNSKDVDQRADIYSLGCSLYVMVTGKPPFGGRTALEVITRHQSDPVVPPDVVVKRVTKALSTILLKMMAKKPEDRYQTMDEVIAVLEGYLGIKQAGPFTPKEEHATQLERATHLYNAASKRGLKKIAALVLGAVGIVGILACGVAGSFSWAGGFLGLLVSAPLAYFLFSGTLSKSVLFSKFRQSLSTVRWSDWATWVGGVILFILALWIFNIIWHFLGFAVLGVGLGYALWYLTDRAQEADRQVPLNEAKQLFKSMRLQGLDEENLRQFVCKYSGDDWEELYEDLFGYDAKLSAREYRKGAVAETSRKFAAWREPIIAGIDAKMRARQEAQERKHLEKVQAKALEAKGVSANEAKEQAAAMADALVEQAAEVKDAAATGKKVDLKQMVKTAKSKRPPEGYNIAGIKKKSQTTRHLLNDWGGRRLRFLVGALVFAVGLMWVNQNPHLTQRVSAAASQVADKAKGGDGKTGASAKDTAADAAKAAMGVFSAPTNPVKIPMLPEGIAKGMSHFGTPICGLLLILTAIAYYGWKPSTIAIPGVLIGSMGPILGIPDVGPLKAWMLGTLIGGAMILVGSWFLRK